MMNMKPIGEIIREHNITLATTDPVALGGFTQVPNFILKDPLLSLGAKVAYSMFLSYAWHNDEDQERSLATELPKLQGEVDALEIRHLSAHEVVLEATNLHRLWPKFTATERRGIVESITERIVITGNEIDITLCNAVSSEELTRRQRNLSDSSMSKSESGVSTASAMACASPRSSVSFRAAAREEFLGSAIEIHLSANATLTSATPGNAPGGLMISRATALGIKTEP